MRFCLILTVVSFFQTGYLRGFLSTSRPSQAPLYAHPLRKSKLPNTLSLSLWSALKTVQQEGRTSSNASILENVKEWCQKEYQINLQHKKWAKLSWKKVTTEDFPDLVSSLLEHDGVNEKECDKIAMRIIEYVKSLLEGSDEVSEETVDLTALRTFFSSEYKGKTVFEFRKYLNDCYDAWTTQIKWYSPYFSVVQSSGYGKSRMCKEFAETDPDWLTVYVCLGKGKNRYPPGQSRAVSVLTDFTAANNQDDCVSKMLSWINALVWLRVMFQFLFIESDENGKETLDQLKLIINTITEGKSSPKDCYTAYSERHKLNNQSNQNKQDLANKERKASWSCCEDENQANIMHSYVQQLQPYCGKKLYPERTKILLVIDEARFLVENELLTDPSFNLFRGFRGAMKEITQSTFAVVVDTVSRLSNFSPSQGEDPSFRNRLGDIPIPNTFLFSPFHWVCTTNALCEDDDTPFLSDRPLWKSFYPSFDVNARADLLKFAKRKLDSDKGTVSTSLAISVLSILTGLSISPISNLAENLVASHMATCLAINEPRDSLYVMYPVEPILSEAAFNIFHDLYTKKEMTIMKDQLFKPLGSSLCFGIVDQGHNGELVAKILLLLARSKTWEQFNEITLERYIKELINYNVPKEYDLQMYFKQMTKNKVLKEYDLSGDVSFTCFTKINRETVPFETFWNSVNPEEMLKRFFVHRAAIEFPEHQKGADLLIPIRQLSKDGTYKYKYILVQVNNELQLKQNESLPKLDPKFVFEGSELWCSYSIGWSLLINVAPEQEKNVHMQFKNNVLIVPCLDKFKHLLHDNLTETFIDILREKTVRQWIPEEKWDLLDSFNPLGNFVLKSCPESQGSSGVEQ